MDFWISPGSTQLCSSTSFAIDPILHRHLVCFFRRTPEASVTALETALQPLGAPKDGPDPVGTRGPAENGAWARPLPYIFSFPTK